MRLLITTQKVDQHDPVLGFFHRWLEEFAHHFEAVTIICLFEGTHSLPKNVRVLTLGKEQKLGRITYLRRLFSYAVQNSDDYDAVLVHMNPEYVVLLGWWWKLKKKKIALWYVHRAVNLKLRIASLFADIIFSSTPYSFRIKSKKARFIGHGIDTTQFQNDGGGREASPLIISAGRITPIKHIETLIEASALLTKKLPTAFRVVLIGEPAKDSDVAYAKEMRELILKRGLSGTISFAGAVPYAEMAKWYTRAWIAANMVPSGGLDKTVIEAMAAGCIPITSNAAYAGSFGPYADQLTFPEKDAPALAERIAALLEGGTIDAVRTYMVTTAKQQFSVEQVVRSVSEGIKTLQ